MENNAANTPAYSELYVLDAQKTIAHSFDYAVNKLNYTLEEYTNLFINFKYIGLIETGNPHYAAGMSGIELARLVCGLGDKKFGRLPYNPGLEFWVGWIVSYYQWSRNLTYKTIFEKFPLERFMMAYPTYHEENRKRMFEYMDSIIFQDT